MGDGGVVAAVGGKGSYWTWGVSEAREINRFPPHPPRDGLIQMIGRREREA